MPTAASGRRAVSNERAAFESLSYTSSEAGCFRMHGATTERSITQRIRGGKGNHFRRTGQPPAGGSRSVLQFRPSATSFTGSTITVAITATTVGVSDSVSITGTMAEAPAAALTAPGAPGAALPADDWA